MTSNDLLYLAAQMEKQSRPTYGSGPEPTGMAAHVVLPALLLHRAIAALREAAKQDA